MVLTACLVLCLTASGDEPKKDAGKDQKIDGKAVTLARTIDFSGNLGLDFATLKTLGVRIDQGRETPDPVGLALAASELAMAEKVSAKQAAVKAADLLTEAVDMAKHRQQPEELRALAFMVGDDKVRTGLEKQADAIVKAQKSGERGRGIGTLTVFNNSGRTVAIYVNDQFVGNVRANNEGSFPVGQYGPDIQDLEGPLETKIIARSGKYHWGPRVVSKDVQNYKFTLNPINE